MSYTNHDLLDTAAQSHIDTFLRRPYRRRLLRWSRLPRTSTLSSLALLVHIYSWILPLRTLALLPTTKYQFYVRSNNFVGSPELDKSYILSPCNYRLHLQRISLVDQSVRTNVQLATIKKKRGGDISSKLSFDGKIQRKAVAQAEYLEVTSSSTRSSSSQSKHKRDKKNDPPPFVSYDRNVFQKFTPVYEMSDFDLFQFSSTDNNPSHNVDSIDTSLSSSFTSTSFTSPTPSLSISSTPQSRKKAVSVNRNILNLLSDDEGEEDFDAPDSSEAAANEIADKLIYSRISDEAKAKANMAVQKREIVEDTQIVDNLSLPIHSELSGASAETVVSSVRQYNDWDDSEDEIHEESVNRVTSAMRRRTKVTASVQETGMDTMSLYVKSLGQHELLPKDSETLLGRQIQILVKWEVVRQKLEEEMSRPPTFGHWASALGITVPDLKKQVRKSQRAKAALIEANLRLVVTVARQSVKKGRSEINFQDACQEGIIGLTKASERFDPERGFRFSTYAIWWIKREIHKSVTEQSRTVKLPAHVMQKINEIRINERLLMNSLGKKPSDDEVAQKCAITVEKLSFYRKAAQDAISLDKKIVARVGKGSNASGGEDNGKTVENTVRDNDPTPTDLVDKEMLRDDVQRLIKTLSPREQAVIRLRFGLDDGTPRTLDFIGKKFSVETDSIRKIEAKALLKLRQPYRNQSVQCYVPDL